MTALDRAFIKAYASRRPLRGAASGSSTTIAELERGGTTYRIDGAHGSSPAEIATPHSKLAARKPRRPSAESTAGASHPVAGAATESAPASETIARRERVIISVNDPVPTTDWIWQREPSPVFAHQASTADPLPPSAPAKRATDKPSSGKQFTPEVLSLGLSAPSTAVAFAPQAIGSPLAASATLTMSPTPIETAATPAPVTPAGTLAMPAAPLAAAMAPQSISIPPAPMFAKTAAASPATAPTAAPAPFSPLKFSPAAFAAAAAPQTDAPASITLPASPPLAGTSLPSPLSSFTITPRVEDRLQPALEVDRFLWPAECSQLIEAAGGALEKFAGQLIDAARCGQRRVALVGTAAGAGTTSVALSLSRMAHKRDGWWGLVDADFAHARLARQLGIAETSGWQTVVTGQDRLADVSIASIDDHLVLVPLSSEPLDQRELTANFRLPVMFSMLSESVDLVLVDAGAAPAADSLAALARSAKIDAVYLVFDERSTSPAELSACAARLRAVGINVSGAIANFAA